MNTQIIGILMLAMLTVAAVLLGVFLVKKKIGWALLCAMLIAVAIGSAGHYLSMPPSVSAAKYLQMGGSVLGIKTFSEYQEGQYVHKVLAKVGNSYIVLDLPPISAFDMNEKAYRVDKKWDQRAGTVKVEELPPTGFGSDFIQVSFIPAQEDPQSRWKNTGKN
ncbi:MAG: hypothetical protein KBC33_03845 [Candidatus Pacebacteria bacterium]|nr:hypothetical protein [Candidatus Paceibacterota bacterium]